MLLEVHVGQFKRATLPRWTSENVLFTLNNSFCMLECGSCLTIWDPCFRACLIYLLFQHFYEPMPEKLVLIRKTSRSTFSYICVQSVASAPLCLWKQQRGGVGLLALPYNVRSMDPFCRWPSERILTLLWHIWEMVDECCSFGITIWTYGLKIQHTHIQLMSMCFMRLGMANVFGFFG